MRKIILLFFIANGLMAQVRFNKSYLNSQNNIEATSVLELADGYLISEKVFLANDSAIGLGIR